MIEVLQSLQYKKNQDLTSIGVSDNGSTLPMYTQQQVNGQWTYTKSYTPKYLEGAINYGVSGVDVEFGQIGDYKALNVSYDPFDLQIDYLKNTIYSVLPNLDIQYFIYWYNIATIYAPVTVQSEVSSKDLYRAFSDSVGYITLYSVSPETTIATASNSANTKAYNRSVENRILDTIRDEIDLGYQAVNSSYALNLANIASSSLPNTSHGDRLVVDQTNTTRYQSASATYLSNIFNIYKQLMYLTPSYATATQTALLVTAPYFTAAIGNTSVVVDKLGNKVNINSGWTEQIMLSAYQTE